MNIHLKKIKTCDFKTLRFIFWISTFIIQVSLFGIQRSSEAMDIEGAHKSFGHAAHTPPQTQEEINAIVSATALKVYSKINQNWEYPATSDPMSTTSSFWEVTGIMRDTVVGSQGKKLGHAYTMVLKDPLVHLSKLDEAFVDLINKPAKAECTIALSTVKIFCLREILGPERFIHYATSFYSVMQAERWPMEDFFHELPFQFIVPKAGPAQPGSICYLTSVPSYFYFKPHGNAGGNNVVCTNPDRYIGFCSIYEAGAQDSDTIVSTDLQFFCDESDVENHLDEHKKKSEEFRQDKKSFAAEQKKAQEESYNFHQIFDLKAINDFVSTGLICT
ncbi:MAG: hypothetical protein B7Y25_06785 [Alphaproteobacteria bacterium 16-39-46]|nr:MAG: hypothetical protein B7Y25_06785 [Alphaproteobacteria bacterium 16-39-46]OZA42064.1 MAG: hypothetical protein B7X84_06950 [Alphaproteobacteria bacterium 17-39-52]HQS84596.1 hypothetical protein [Alphaproteobacteria bacterium]HQS94424.1 hypothetical protein [Alphaproteobacteria bacterium]